MESPLNPAYTSEPVRRTTNGFGLTSMLLGLFNIALILVAVIGMYSFFGGLNEANGITFQDYEAFDSAAIQEMASEYGDQAQPFSFIISMLASCLTIPVSLLGVILGFIGLLQQGAPKMGSILGLVLNMPLLLLCGLGMLLSLAATATASV